MPFFSPQQYQRKHVEVLAPNYGEGVIHRSSERINESSR